ncbi:putative membrane-associated nucleotidase [[Clostridium] sordellii ATCC 9714]|nr:putative membrane-associated nucleotidase [[Clostridium] sordellii ATCC 9714] [Paeniclostridium sordellii ATCC 9714]
MKTVPTSKGTVKVGILGLTIKEIDQRYETLLNGEEKIVTYELKDLKGINGSLYMNDLVEEAKYWVPVMKKDNPDIIIAVVHSGEKEKMKKKLEIRFKI